MQPPAIPADEVLRLQALRAQGLLDTAAEERFDRLTRLARRFFGVEMALISLVDAERQWFKSRQGLDACETGRDVSFCGHAILGDDIFQVFDARTDERFADNPLVTGPPHIRFYAGMPLSVAGHRIGTLCLVDSRARRLAADEREALRELAACVEAEIGRTELLRQGVALEQSQRLGAAIVRAQSRFIAEANRRQAFDGLLADILDLTGSAYGFIGEVLRRPDGQPYLKTYAITNIAWNEETRAFYETHAPQGMEFSNLNTLFGAALTGGQPVIANDPYHDPRRGGLPEGHPALNAFLGVPVYHGGEMMAMYGVANRPGGYDEALIEFLQPLTATLGQLVAAARIHRTHQEGQAMLTRLSRVASQTTNGVIITDVDGRVEWINEGFTRLTGYTLEEMLGRKPGEILQGPATDPATIAAVHAALARREGFAVDVVNYAKDGRPYWIRIGCNPLRDEAGNLQGFMAIESDITREKADAERIRASERRLASVIDGTRIGTWEWNVQTGETVFNERWAEIVGYTLAELQPVSIRTWLDLAHPDDLKASGELLDRHFRRELDHYDFQCRMRHKAGHWVWVHDRGRVVSRTDDGKPLLMSGTHADITAQKQAEQALQQSEARLRGLFELSPVGIALNDFATGAFLDGNAALFAPAGYTRDEFVALSYWDLTPREYEPQEKAQLESMERTGRYGPYEKEYIRKDGSRYPVLLNGMVVCDPDGRKLIWSIVEDISERKRMERMKNEFISTVSHELRTPLTSISGALGLVAGGALGGMPEQARQMIEIAHKNSQRLTHLVNDLLDMEKIAAGKLHFEMQVQPLMPLVRQALDGHRTYGAERRVALVLAGEAEHAEVRVDGQRLMQVLANLLSNAIKFSPEGGTVEVTVEFDAGRARVGVRDHGPGIPAAFRSRIFEKFAQADASDTRRTGGTGLGLAITRELVERMGGTIGFDSVEGEGATFWIELPLAAVAQPAVPGGALAAADAPHILVVEDEPDVARLLSMMLTRAGYRVDVALTGQDALAAVEATPYDALSLDLMLPDIGGLEIIRRVRQRTETADLPIVVLSARMEEGRLAINGDFSAIDWLAKPIDERRLLAVLDRLLVQAGAAYARVLHVEDDDDLYRVVRAMVGARFDFEQAKTLDEARARVALERYDVVILDIGLPDGSGWDVLPEIRARQPQARVVILSGTDTSAEEARRVEAVLLKSQVSPRQLIDALDSRIQSIQATRNTP